MDMNDIILKKRDGGVLTGNEIQYFIKGCVEGEIPDYQISALLMAIYFQNLNREEVFELTEAMRNSGDTVDLSAIKGIKVDKHSTGGVGDKTTLICAPLAAACGVPVAKMSGRGLGFTGGTVDKMEAVPGLRTNLEPEEFLDQVNAVGIALIGQTSHIAPADKKLYALRDVTATVENFGLIASSIMSKKLAAGSDAILLDVKCGNGAFMEKYEDAITLGNIMCDIGSAASKRTVAVVTDMSQPLGHAVGNSIEVIEAIETLKGRGPDDLTELSLKLAGLMIYLGGRAKTAEEGQVMAGHAMASGAGLKKLKIFIEMQGGNPDVAEDYTLFPKAAIKKELKAEAGGVVKSIEARRVGDASQKTGAGRKTKEDSIDLAAGIYVKKKRGDKVNKDDVLAVVYGNDDRKVEEAFHEISTAFEISGEKTAPSELIKTVLGL